MGIGGDRMNPGSYKPYSLVLCVFQIGVKILSLGAHVHVKNGTVQRGLTMILGHHRLFYGIHTAHRRAIAVFTAVLISGSHTLEPGNFFGFFFVFFVRGQHQVPPLGTGGGKHPFKSHGGDNIRVFAKRQIIKTRWIKGLKAR